MIKSYIKADFINSFILATVEVLEKNANLKSKRGELHLKSSVFSKLDIGVLLDVEDGMDVYITYCMSESTAKSLASSMMFGVFLEDFDEMAKSALIEIFVIIVDKASKKLRESGFDCKIKPPDFIRYENDKLYYPTEYAISLPIFIQSGEIEINMGLKKRQ